MINSLGVLMWNLASFSSLFSQKSEKGSGNPAISHVYGKSVVCCYGLFTQLFLYPLCINERKTWFDCFLSQCCYELLMKMRSFQQRCLLRIFNYNWKRTNENDLRFSTCLGLLGSGGSSRNVSLSPCGDRGVFDFRSYDKIEGKTHHCHSRALSSNSTTVAATNLLKNDRTSDSNSKRFEGPSLVDFLSTNGHGNNTSQPEDHFIDDSYLPSELFYGHQRSVFIETYGCQMNVNDTEIVWSILQQYGFERATTLKQADIVLAVTCAIREGAEEKIWKRLQYFASLKRRRGRKNPLQIGLLGCMAERLKHKIVEKEQMVDVVCGPDAYRDLPRLLSLSSSTEQAAVNVQLSLEETYADVVPVRINTESPSAFVSIMRGCDNMCTYCIVPFTRGRERSRAISTIRDEVTHLSEQGVKEVTLLGQNVNSYRDLSQSTEDLANVTTVLSAGFKTVYKAKTGGRRFARLLEDVARVNPEMRIRFTSPHPKDFPDEVLHVINENPNICRQIHLPAQSGNSSVLSAMGRGYTREAYLTLVDHIRCIIPDVALSSDFIAGFCGETDEAHKDTVSLMDIVKYNFAFCFPYSMREKTRAFHRLKDDVPKDVKMHRHTELIDTFRKHAEDRHRLQVGQVHLVLVEGESKRSSSELCGRNDANAKVVFPDVDLLDFSQTEMGRHALPGDFVAVQITSGNSLGFRGQALYLTSIREFWQENKSAVISSHSGLQDQCSN